MGRTANGTNTKVQRETVSGMITTHILKLSNPFIADIGCNTRITLAYHLVLPATHAPLSPCSAKTITYGQAQQGT